MEQIWKSKLLTNNGAFYQKLREGLSEYLDVWNISLVTNNRLGLLTALKSLRITGELVTSPYLSAPVNLSCIEESSKKVLCMPRNLKLGKVQRIAEIVRNASK